jgi:hypothetical protein
VKFGFIRQNHIWIQQTVRVDDSLESSHNSDRLCSPFDLNERSHVAARSMFGFERPIKSMNNQVDHIINEPSILVCVVVVGHWLRNDEMEIAVASVPEDDTVCILMFHKQGLQFANGSSEPFQWKRSVL